ncbi:MAG: hypothetical protein ACOC3V_03015 [bacterium]
MKKIFFVLIFFLSFSLFAFNNDRIIGHLEIENETIKIASSNQVIKIRHHTGVIQLNEETLSVFNQLIQKYIELIDIIDKDIAYETQAGGMISTNEKELRFYFYAIPEKEPKVYIDIIYKKYLRNTIIFTRPQFEELLTLLDESEKEVQVISSKIKKVENKIQEIKSIN